MCHSLLLPLLVIGEPSRTGVEDRGEGAVRRRRGDGAAAGWLGQNSADGRREKAPGGIGSFCGERSDRLSGRADTYPGRLLAEATPMDGMGWRGPVIASRSNIRGKPGSRLRAPVAKGGPTSGAGPMRHASVRFARGNLQASPMLCSAMQDQDPRGRSSPRPGIPPCATPIASLGLGAVRGARD